MRKTAFLTAALLALLVLPALAVFGSGSAPALAAKAKQKDKAAATTDYGGVSGTITAVQNGVLTLTTAQNKPVSMSIDSYTLVLKGGPVPASALRAGDRVLVNPSFKAIAGENGNSKPATDPREDKSATKPSTSSAQTGNKDNGTGTAAPPAAGDRGAAGQQTNPENKGVPAGASGNGASAGNSSAASGSRDNAGALVAARLVWVQQQGETLVYGLVRSVSGGTVVLKTGAQNQTTVQVSASTVYARQVPEGAAGSKNAARTELKQGSHVVVVAGGSAARVVLFITPPPNSNRDNGSK